MLGFELAKAFSFSLRFTGLKALQQSTYKILEELDEVSFFSYESLVECIMASAPTFTPAPNCRFWKSSFATEFVSLDKHLSICLLKTSLTAIERISPFFYNKLDSDALQRACETNSGRSRRQRMFTSLVTTVKAFCDWSQGVYCTACKRCSGNSLKWQLL